MRFYSPEEHAQTTHLALGCTPLRQYAAVSREHGHSNPLLNIARAQNSILGTNMLPLYNEAASNVLAYRWREKAPRNMNTSFLTGPVSHRFYVKYSCFGKPVYRGFYGILQKIFEKVLQKQFLCRNIPYSPKNGTHGHKTMQRTSESRISPSSLPVSANAICGFLTNSEPR